MISYTIELIKSELVCQFILYVFLKMLIIKPHCSTKYVDVAYC